MQEALVAPLPAGAAMAVPAGTTTELVFQGRSRFGIDQWAYVPFQVPPGVRRITVSARHHRFPVAGGLGNVLDLGIFGPAGWDIGNADGFRGWSGGARTGFTISAVDATPGYLAGPIDPGTWAVALGPVVLDPRGMGWRVRVVLEHGDPAPAPATELPADLALSTMDSSGTRWYRGDLHLHSVHSDGRRTLDGLATEARDAGLDFLASTEHNTSAANRAWSAGHRNGPLVLPGEEVTTRHGHWLALGLPPGGWVDWRYAPRDGVFPGLARQVRDGGGLVVAAHPAVPLPGAAWEFGYRHVDAVEVWNGRWGLDDEVSLRIWHRLLRRGRRVTAVAGSDSHAGHQPVGEPQTVVHADALSVPALVAGVRRGRAYLAESSAVTLGLTASRGSDAATAGPGQTLVVGSGTPVTVAATVAGVAGTTVAIITAAGRVAQATVDASGVGHVRWTTTGAAARFARVEVRRTTRRRPLAPMVALSNPVWLRPDGR
jgi:hypothetical protein